MYRSTRVQIVFALTIVIGLWGFTCPTSTQSADPAYGVTDLGALGGDSSIARALTESSIPTIVGTATTASGERHAFTSGGRAMTDLGTLGGSNSDAYAVAGAVVVGRAQLPSGAYHAFAKYTSTGGLVDLGTLGGTESYAAGVARSGTIVVGASRTIGDENTAAFVYRDGAISPLGATLGGPNSAASDVNDYGDVAGFADLPDGRGYHAFLYSAGNTIDLGSLGGNSSAVALNESGVVVGRSGLASGTNHHAFRYENGVMEDLGTLGGPSSEAFDVNGNGLIVGSAETSDGVPHAFIWRDGIMTDLNTLIPRGTGWVLQAATGAGNRAEGIAGYGLHNGQLRAFLLTPPLDVGMSLRLHKSLTDTNIPNPHEAGQLLRLGVTAINPLIPPVSYDATGVTVVDEISGPFEYVQWDRDCVQNGQRLTCQLGFVPAGGLFVAVDLNVYVRATGPGDLTHTATLTADQPDPNPSNNTATEYNRAVSLASLTLNPEMLTGGHSSLGRVTLTSRANAGDAVVSLSSSDPDVARVPTRVNIHGWDEGSFREFYIETNPVSAPVTVEIIATYGGRTFAVPLTVMPAGSQWPYGGTVRSIPGVIQAEEFDEGDEGAAYHDATVGNDGNAFRWSDVDIGATSDSGEEWNVGWIDAGEWLEYTVQVAAAGTYTLEARVASPSAGGTFHVEFDGVDKTGPISIPATGGWHTWMTIARTVSLDPGAQVLRVQFDRLGPGDTIGNLNYLRFLASGGSAEPAPYGGSPRSVPGTVETEDFDEGGEGVGYHDHTPENSGGEYRSTGVDVERTADVEGGYNVGWMRPGEWLTYTVSVEQDDTYTLVARVAANGAGGTFHVEFGGVDKTGPLTIIDTGDWQYWTDVTATVTLNAGVQTMRIVVDSAGPTGVFGNINRVTLTTR